MSPRLRGYHASSRRASYATRLASRFKIPRFLMIIDTARASRPAQVVERLAGAPHRATPARVAYVTPSADAGRSRWLGEGQPLSFRLCRAIRGVLAGAEVRADLSRRAREHLARLRARFPWVEEGRTALVADASGTTRWWTFAGLRANTALGTSLKPLMEPRGAWGNLAIPLRPEAKASDVRSVLGDVAAEALIANVPVSDTTIDGLKFSVCLPAHLARRVLHLRMADVEGTRACLERPIVGVTVA